VSYTRSRVLASACTLALTMAATGARAADAGSADRQTIDEVVVTGSLISGTPEDTALPVEVISEEELRDMGRPSNLDLVKTMSEVGQVAGEAYRYNGYPVGAATINLRNLGARYTTVIFNGRRFPEQYSVATGRFNNINWIPNAAIGSVEVLKEGGAVTYGADAVGGVVNYITRRNVDGLEVNADYRYIDGSDGGDYDADALWGRKFERGNFMVVGAYQHRSHVDALERNFGKLGPLENRTAANWVASGSPGSYAFIPSGGVRGQTGTGTITPAVLTPTNAATTFVGNRQMSGTGIVRDPNCNALGGVAGWSATPSPACYLQIAQFESLVEESNQYQLYTEFNYNLTDKTSLHVEGLYYQQDLPDIYAYPGDSPGAFPLIAGSATGATQLVGASSAYFVSGHNPAVAQFLNSFYNADGVTTAFTPAQIAAITTNGRAALPTGIWRPFGNGGNPDSGRNDSQHNNNKLYRLTAGLKGDLWGTGFGWDVGVTYSHVNYSVEIRDMLVDRLQAALNGFGGSNCNDIEAGQPGSTCQWLNPFSSAIERNAYTGATNPGYVSSLANDVSLVRWLYTPLSLAREYDYVVADAVVSGDTGWNLPGGPVAVAVGTQYRYTGEEFIVDDLSNRDLNPCATPGVQTCASRTGPLAFTRNVTVLGTTQNTKRHYPVVAAFAEAQLPLLSTVNLQLAGRYEKFYSDVTDRDNDVFVPAAAIKWQPLDWFAVRASGGKTFTQVNPPQDDGPVIANVAAANNAFGGILGYQTAGYDNVDVKPSKGDYFSVGFLFAVDRFTANVDFFDTRITDFARTMTANTILRALVGQTATQASPLDCSSPLFAPQASLGGRPFVQLSSPCEQGTTTLGSLNNNGAVINYFAGTDQVNGGELHTSGIDLGLSVAFDDPWGGTFRPSLDVSYNLEYELSDFILYGVNVADGYDGRGFKNGSTGRLGIAVPDYRGSIGLNYRNGRHAINLLATYRPSLVNEDPSDFDASNDQNANVGDANGVVTTGAPGSGSCLVNFSNLQTSVGNVPAGSGTGQFGGASTGVAGALQPRGFCANQNAANVAGRTIKSNTNFDLTYRVELTESLNMSLSIYNLLDQEPSFDRSTLGYDTGFGSPLERNYKLGFQMKF
jgi:iron complex outermembrane receptor protein